MVSVVSTIDMGVSIVSTMKVSMAVSMTIVSVWVSVSKGVSVVVVSISLRGSLSSSSGLSLSLPLAIVVSMAIGVRVSMVGQSMDGGDYRVVGIGKTMAIAIVGIGLRFCRSDGNNESYEKSLKEKWMRLLYTKSVILA